MFGKQGKVRIVVSAAEDCLSNFSTFSLSSRHRGRDFIWMELPTVHYPWQDEIKNEERVCVKANIK